MIAMAIKPPILFILLFMCGTLVTGQTPKKKIVVKKGKQVVLRDTIFIVKRDTILFLTADEMERVKIRENPSVKSSKFYDSLEKKASTSKITKDIFDFVVIKKGRKEKMVSVIVKSEELFKPYEGYTIASIVYKSVDLLEGSVIDTVQKATSKLARYINRVHVDTRSSIIENNLLFKVGDTVDPYQLADNERILRQFKTLRDARIYVTKSKLLPKAVDVVVVTQDVASIGVSGDYTSPQNYRLDVYDINILGYAKQLQASYFRSTLDNPTSGYEVILRESNFSNTFIQGELQYTENYLRQRGRIAIARDFFTPNIKYAGGLELYQTREKFYFEEYDTLQIPYTENNLDVWFGRSIQIKKRTNIIFAARANALHFIDRPYVSSDSNSFFHNRTLLLGSVTLTERNFMKGFRIRGFGKSEDILVGGTVSLIAGKEINQFINRNYLEVDGNFGRYFPAVGYFNLSVAASSFFKPRKTEDGLVSTSVTYFSNLLKIRKMQVRHFVYAGYTKGFNRILDRTISITGGRKDERGLPPLGNQRVTLGYETVYFMPWYPYGFQFALFHRIDINLLSTGSTLFGNATLFPSIQIGARILNENLVLPKFSIDLTYYASNKNYNSAWQLNFSTTLVNLFGTSQVFKPRIAGFD
jgi:hypothetical protein